MTIVDCSTICTHSRSKIIAEMNAADIRFANRDDLFLTKAQSCLERTSDAGRLKDTIDFARLAAEPDDEDG